MEKSILLNGLSMAGWNRDRAAQLLGVSRATLFRAMRQHAIELPKSHSRLTRLDVTTIRTLASSGASHRSIAGQFQISKTTVHRVVSCYTFKSIGGPKSLTKRS
jgi:predicted DNA-binding protein (UPF0251 family)